MIAKGTPPSPDRDRRAYRSDIGAEKSWENEGGASRAGAYAAPTEAGVRERVDDRQDQLMTLSSTDGRPPSHHSRMIEWRWFGAVALLVFAGAITWAAIARVEWQIVAAGLGFGVVLVIGMLPVLFAGVLRGGEEYAARKTALYEQRAPRSHLR